MGKVNLRCGVCGGSQKAIFDGQRYRERFTFPPSALTLYLAGKKEGEEIKWLKDDDNLDALLQGDANKENMKMRSSWLLEAYFGENFQPGRKDTHVLVELPAAAASVEPMMRVFWLVTGSVENALDTRGVRSRLYRMAEAELGYYDPANVLPDNKVQAFWYTNNDLQIHVLFKEEEHALHFHIRLHTDFITIPITSRVSRAPCPRNEQCIYSREYDAPESESPRETMSSVSPVFKYQRIEIGTVFGPHGKAESAHLMSGSQCRQVKSCAQYDDDDNNRLALSHEMRGAYDSLGFDFPVVNMEVVFVSKLPVLDNRYQVRRHHFWMWAETEISCRVGRSACFGTQQTLFFLLGRLKEDSARTSDPLVMKTFVHVEDPVIFCKNMAWKHKNVEQLRQDYFSMNSAVM
ncbi:hypothetical protein V7S43_016905 [Phytophthora oleae]|uniref:Crinkler effector protein N-terminal domain-containing protein n=1 Tax=Phytophthora oleae TaxID=2107226 RepID=A0ABD3EXK8_9STRA